MTWLNTEPLQDKGYLQSPISRRPTYRQKFGHFYTEEQRNSVNKVKGA